MTEAVRLLKRKALREKAHTAMVVAGAASTIFAAIALAAIAVGAVHVLLKVW